MEIKNCQPSILEIVDIDFLSEMIMNLLEDNNQELYLHCWVSNISSINEISTKELANKIIELIRDADGYHWNYNHLYEGKDNITYWYFCSGILQMFLTVFRDQGVQPLFFLINQL